MSDCPQDGLVETNTSKENSDEEMGQAKSQPKKLTKSNCKRQMDDFTHIALSGEEHTFMCGVVEGFYGRPWTAEQRKELFRRMEEMGLNTYLYAPKDDYKHRLFWREKYSEDEAELLKNLIREADDHNVTFVYAISPGLDMVFGSEKEITFLKSKLLQVKELGCKAFALLFDDIDPVLCASDMAEFQSSAHAQASITNMMFEALDKPRFLFCPTEYCNSMAIPDVKNSIYLNTLGASLHPLVSVMWTGPKVVSNTIPLESIALLTSVLKRKVVIWDNIHANDYDPKRVFLGPYNGRSTCLIPHLSGALTNPNCEFEANYIAMHTLSTWWKSYRKDKTADDPIQEVLGEAAKESKDVQALNSASTASSNDAEQSSISSGRASDGDSDTDSDYSSHDESIYPIMTNFDHGDYLPRVALAQAIKDWLPLFSSVRYPTRKPVPRSGTLPVIPLLPALPIISHPQASTTCVTSTATKPVVSSCFSGVSPPLCPDAEKRDEDAQTSQNIQRDSTAGAGETPEVSRTSPVEADIDMKTEKEPGTKSGDVDPVPKTKQENSSGDSLPEAAAVQGDAQGDATRNKSDVVEAQTTVEVEKANSGVTPALSDADIEMNEEKSSEAMQTEQEASLKSSSSVVQMETEDAACVEGSTTPMQTDDVDSDVSMATAQNSTVLQTDIDDMGSPYICVDEDGKLVKQVVPTAEVSKEPTKSTESVNDEEMATPPVSEKKRTEVTYNPEPITTETLNILVECFYLPYEHGMHGREMISRFKWLKENAFKLSKAVEKNSESYLDKALEWSERALAFEEQCKSLLKVFNQICSCPNRALLFDLFPYLWDMKGLVTMLRSYVKWLGTIEVKSATTVEDKNTSPPSTPATMQASSPATFGWLGPDPEPWVFRGGLSGEFQRLLPVGSAFDLFCQNLPLTPEVCTYVVRPYVPSDVVSIVELCYSTHNDGVGSLDSFTEHKDLPADRLTGALLALSPDYCFVVEDETGICGYLAATLNAKKFWKKYELAYLPDMRKKYTKPETEGDMSEAEKMIVDLHSTADRFSYASENLNVTHPSMMTLALRPKAKANIAKSMTVCLLSALKSHNSCGVHVVISQDSIHLLDLYTKLGFVHLTTCDGDLQVLGRTF